MLRECLPSYSLSFTAASLRPELCRILAEDFLATGDWMATKSRILQANALQARNANSAIRMERELRQRLQVLTPAQLVVLAQSESEDRAAMAWLAMLKYNPFAFDFASALLRDKLATHDVVLHRSDYESFVAEKSAGHPELAMLTEATKTKVRNVLLRMLIEAGLLTKGAALGTIQQPILSVRARQVIRDDHVRWFAGFLLTDGEIQRA
ncbi:MAG: hypothetical protein JW395_3926 [Nitrospira sp.]|nr:hypothetical protein [Nitrospira sp.]